MPSNLYPTGVRMNDGADVLAAMQVKAPTTINVAGPATFSAGDISGGHDVTLISSNAAPGTLTTRTALQMYGDDPASYPGYGYNLRICNSGAGTMTVAAGANFTLTGTMTIATATYRDFRVIYAGTPGAPTVTMTNVGLGTYT